MSNDKPWITPQFKSLVVRRQKALLSGDIVLYNKLRNQVNRDKESLAPDFYKSSVAKLSTEDSRGWWRTVKCLLGLSGKSDAVQTFANNNYDGDLEALISDINQFLASVSADLEPLSQDIIPECPAEPLPDEYIISVDTTLKQLLSLKVNKAIGPDNIPNWFLKDFADTLAGPMCAIQNSSLREAYIPDRWRTANQTPLPKQVPMKDITKHVRPISLTPVPSKLMEAHPVGILKKACPMVDPSQFGCMDEASTTHALLRILQPVYKAVDISSQFARSLLVDFSKAFDHIDHNVIITKLKDNGAPPHVTRWFAAFLSDRKQRVKIGQSTSDWVSPNGGVPQGTLSGPQLFVHMVSDLHTDHPDVKFMDDATITEIRQKAKGSELQNSADQVCDWSAINHLGINTDKTKEMLFSFGNPPAIDPLVMNGVEIERVHETKLLGVMITDDLKWDTHIDYVNKKASKRLYFLRRLKRSGLDSRELIVLYVSMIRSVLEYACPVWSTCLTIGLSDTLESIQIRAFRIIDSSLSYEEACEKFQMQTLKERREEICKKFFMKMTNPTHRLHDLLPEPKTHKHDLRVQLTYPLPRCHTNRYKNSFVPWCLYNLQ